jgi:hypothetical protein
MILISSKLITFGSSNEINRNATTLSQAVTRKAFRLSSRSIRGTCRIGCGGVSDVRWLILQNKVKLGAKPQRREPPEARHGRE